MRRASFFLLLALVACGSDDAGVAAGAVDAAVGPDAPSAFQEAGPVPASVPCGEPTGKRYYVSPSGDDGNQGTESSPWKTLQKAAAAAAPGDGVLLMPGTWTEPLAPQTSGAEGHYILFAAQDPANPPVIDGAGALEDLVVLEDLRYVKLCNLLLKNALDYGVRIGGGDHVAVLGVSVDTAGEAAIYAEGSDDLLIEGCSTRDTISSGIGVWYAKNVAVRKNRIVNACYSESESHEESLTISGVEDFEVSGNEIWFDRPGVEAGSAAIKIKESSRRGRVFGNYAHDFPEGSIGLDAWEAGLNGSPTLSSIDIHANRIERAGGIRVSSEELGVVENINIFNNVLIHTNNGILITASAKNGPKWNVSIYNNTIYEGAADGWGGVWIMTRNFKNAVIRNNIVVSNDWSMGKITLGYKDMLPEVTVDHNLVLGEKNGMDGFPDAVELSDLPGNATADPKFVDATSGDLQLSPGSPAIDTGAAMPGLLTDFDGAKRPAGAGWDIGAYESQ